LREFLEDQGFRSLVARLNGTSQVRAPSDVPSQIPAQRDVRPEPKIDRSAYETVVTEDALDRWIAEARSNGLVAVDTETNGYDCVTAELVGISVATQCGKAVIFRLSTADTTCFRSGPSSFRRSW
jgi:DNA polymerase-1